MGTAIPRASNSWCHGVHATFRLLPYTVSKAQWQTIHNVHLCFLLPLGHTPPSPTVILSNSLLISSQPFSYLLPLYSPLWLLQIFSIFLSGQKVPADRCGKGRWGQSRLSLPHFLYRERRTNYSAKTGSSLWPLKPLSSWRYTSLLTVIFSRLLLPLVPVLISLVSQPFLLIHCP